ncbi:hypothetical protein K435DRAFT_799804 [Dendrothele bispora CBS 962.96]|uniref:Uncharacterized protein n=1 Tax=Dendrothele bispora (strain CBS 962.96) TaxID=1314807 RepID=A0A4S8LUQ0_DENBC|nr:hypothetical protein K435DRAFT_799804 [Dendrothele bispora CBS 962.96]
MYEQKLKEDGPTRDPTTNPDPEEFMWSSGILVKISTTLSAVMSLKINRIETLFKPFTDWEKIWLTKDIPVPARTIAARVSAQSHFQRLADLVRYNRHRITFFDVFCRGYGSGLGGLLHCTTNKRVCTDLLDITQNVLLDWGNIFPTKAHTIGGITTALIASETRLDVTKWFLLADTKKNDYNVDYVSFVVSSVGVNGGVEVAGGAAPSFISKKCRVYRMSWV